MTGDPLADALVHARSLLIDLERHVDRAAPDRDLAEVGRAWVRAAQVERLLRSALPPEATTEMSITEPPQAAGPDSHGSNGSEPRPEI